MKRTVIGLLLLVFCFSLLSSDQGEWEKGIHTCTAILDQIRAYYPEPADETELVHASLHGLLARLDPHSYFLDADSFRSMFEDQAGNYFGIGTRIRRIEGRLTVIAPIEGTPAFHLGILPGDVIASIDGRPTRDMTLDEAMKYLRGRKGTRVTITVDRPGNPDMLTFQINRTEIPLATLTHALVEPNDQRTGYIGLRTFGRTTADEFRKAVDSLVLRQGVHRLVIDLRWNTGGSLAAAIELSDFFLDPGRPIVTLRGRSLERGFTSREHPLWPKIELAVLINRYSASASEILAAALQEHGRA
ncbi:MAG: S41 family peptidase, partial [Candidatus Aminicenantes bacterium]|nr:S41 family peptidase [Candidatus Aminicenantes bacterium]